MGILPDSPHEGSREPDRATESGSILGRAEFFSRAKAHMFNHAIDPFALVIERYDNAVEATVHGRPTILFGTNSYLGLNFHPACVAAAIEATRSSGTGSTASRVASGNTRGHVSLESTVAEFYGRRFAVVFSAGFMANLGVIGALAKTGDAIFLDEYCHASILDACRLSGAQIELFKHNDADDLARLFAASRVPGGRTIVIVEGVYSVWGDLADLRNIFRVAKRHRAVTIVDEAHGFGIYGTRGRGAAEHLGVEDQADIVVGTFSKSAGVIGGFCVTNLHALRELRLMSRSYLYTASLPPAVVAAAREAVRLIGSQPELRIAVWRNAAALRAGLNDLGLPLASGDGPIGAIRMPSVKAGLSLWAELLDRGIYMNLLIPPATPGRSAMLRFSVSAAHTPAHIDAALGAMAGAWAQIGAGKRSRIGSTISA
jgi:8-amino-7-oxononanoate synthase